MSHLIIIDEPALKECVESNIYQSRHFEAGDKLAKALSGDRSVAAISPRIVATWKKDYLFILKSRTETGYLTIDSKLFDTLHQEKQKAAYFDDILLIFQKVCRFAIKEWNGLGFSYSEMWSTKTDCAAVFPFPKSKHSAYRLTIKKGTVDERHAVRHGTKQLFAFAGGSKEEAKANTDQERLYKRAFEELSAVRLSVEVQIKQAAKIPSDAGYHPLILTAANQDTIKYQPYDSWLERLTKQQKAFVCSSTDKPQRVEGPAGTGKTLCLLLRAHYLCKNAECETREFRILFVAHSESTKSATSIALDSLGEPFYHQRPRNSSNQSIELYTLQEWCGQVLGTKEIATTQYLDQDALQAKEMRKLLIKDVVNKRLKEDAKSLDYLTPLCRDFFCKENDEYVAELLQHEIGVMIKGRAAESLETYLKLPPLTYCLPTKSENDRRYVYSLYTEYQKELNTQGVYDTDDIVLSALGRLNTPIWRRRRIVEGYDAVIIDETHLFNFNELSVFHHLVRDPENPRIIFSIDRTQAPGERGITSKLVKEILTQSLTSDELETRTQVIFRCAPNIVKLAEAITAAGATLFTTFENPLIDTTSVITAADEDLAMEALYWKCSNDDAMCDNVVARAKEVSNKLKCPVSEVLIIAMDDELIPKLRDSFKTKNLRIVQILQRGDLDTVRRGAKESAFIVSHPDYVGGLEFKAVLIVGVDEGRVPPSEGALKSESKHFVEFKACNRMYVSITRARLVVEMFYSSERGASPLLKHAKATNVITEKSFGATS